MIELEDLKRWLKDRSECHFQSASRSEGLPSQPWDLGATWAFQRALDYMDGDTIYKSVEMPEKEESK